MRKRKEHSRCGKFSLLGFTIKIIRLVVFQLFLGMDCIVNYANSFLRKERGEGTFATLVGV